MRIRHTSTEEQEVNPKPRLASETDDRDSDAFRDLMTPEALVRVPFVRARKGLE